MKWLEGSESRAILNNVKQKISLIKKNTGLGEMILKRISICKRNDVKKHLPRMKGEINRRTFENKV